MNCMHQPLFTELQRQDSGSSLWWQMELHASNRPSQLHFAFQIIQCKAALCTHAMQCSADCSRVLEARRARSSTAERWR